MKRIVFTKHAEEMMLVRNLKKDLVESCLTHPDQILQAKYGKVIYLKDLGSNYLKIIVSDEKSLLVIITLYWIAKKRIKL